jgi:hypothetical protein
VKKFTALLICSLAVSFAVFAYSESEWGDDDNSTPPKKNEVVTKELTNTYTANEEADDDEEDDTGGGTKAKKSKRLFDRTFEIGLINASVGFDNDFLAIRDIFKETMKINLDELQKGLNIGFHLISSPVYFNFKRDYWGFGINTKVDVSGSLALAGKMITFREAVNEKSDLNAAVFAEIGINGYLTISNLKIKVKPAVFYPVIYLKTKNISYTNKDNFNISYNVRFFQAWDDNYSLTASPGFDLYAGVEYPLADVLGLSRIPILDFGIGVDLTGIRIVRATIRDYTEYSGHFGSESGLFDIFGDQSEGGFGDLFEMNDPVSGKEDYAVARPFRLKVWADWRPLFGTNLLTIYPMIGFSINPIFNEMFSMEYGIKGRLDLLNLFIVEFTIKQEDRLWQNCLDLALNLKVFELDVGINMRSASFAKSWSGGGFGLNFGLKFGW